MASLRERTAAKSVQGGKIDDQQSNGNVVHKGLSQKIQDSVSSPAGSVTTTLLSPALITTFVLIFGGCCSNVYTLESILSLSPATGSLVTFLQFFLTTVFTLPSQFTTKSPHSTSNASSSSSWVPRLRARNVPIYKWIVYTVMFLAVNILNNTAFNYRISIPLHIILRSAGPVTSMFIGYVVAGRRYEPRKILSVALLFCGVVLAALSDASSKGKLSSSSSANDNGAGIRSSGSELSKQLPGFILVFLALVISAFMGLYTDRLYQQHGRSAAVANENLFYSHMLSLPYFASQYQELFGQFFVLAAVADTTAGSSQHSDISKSFGVAKLSPLFRFLASYLPFDVFSTFGVLPLTPILLLLANACTQIVCITGVHRLAAQTTSLTVSVVLNVRKLISLVLSIWLFGNRLSLGVTVGAVLVFLGGGLYGIPSSSSSSSSSSGTVSRCKAGKAPHGREDGRDRKDR